jgi:hypothetical protein
LLMLPCCRAETNISDENFQTGGRLALYVIVGELCRKIEADKAVEDSFGSPAKTMIISEVDGS